VLIHANSANLFIRDKFLNNSKAPSSLFTKALLAGYFLFLTLFDYLGPVIIIVLPVLIIATLIYIIKGFSSVFFKTKD
jgi:hypothetical protein